jgi:hypothetical protein
MKNFLFTLLKKMELSPKWKNREILVGDVLLDNCKVFPMGNSYLVEWNGNRYDLGCTVIGTTDLFDKSGSGLFSKLDRMPISKLEVLLRHPKIARDLCVTYMGDSYVIQKPYISRFPLNGNFFLCDLLLDGKRIRGIKPMLVPADEATLHFYSDKTFEQSSADLYAEMAEVLFKQTKSIISLSGVLSC